MNIRPVVLIALALMIGPIAWSQQSEQSGEVPSPVTAAPSPSSYTVETALIEQVLWAPDDGYQFDAYIVRWHGVRILVSDTIGLTHRKVGDSIKFIVHHHDINGNRLLAFIDVDPDPRPTSPRREGSGSGSAVLSTSETATVDEVLSAQEDGYRFVAYLVTRQGAQIAISDPLAHSHYALGEQLRFTAYKLAMQGDHNLGFTVIPGKTGTAPPATFTEETAIVDEVLNAGIDGYRYRAYVVQWHGTRIAVSESPAAPQRRVGESIPFQVSRTPGGVLHFVASSRSAEGTGTVEPTELSLTQESAPVDEVLTAQSGESRYIAYIVKWHGARVAVTDMFANTRHAVGDVIGFPVSRAVSAGDQEMDFILFDFSKLPAGSSNCDRQIVTCGEFGSGAARLVVGNPKGG